jgi:hypothetical protein
VTPPQVVLDDAQPAPVPPWKEADVEDRKRAAGISRGAERRSVSFDVEEAFSERDEEFHPALVKVRCPTCHRTRAPLLSPATRRLGGGWRWVGISYEESYCDWLCTCSRCGTDYILTTHSPQ